jgi:hypothetical protein
LYEDRTGLQRGCRSLKIWRSRAWFDHKAQVGGRGALTLIQHYLGGEATTAVTWAKTFLAQRPTGLGPCRG